MITREDLRTIPIFERLTEGDVAVLLNLWKPRTVKEGQILFRQGDTGDSMFLIEEGALEITVPVDQPQKEMRVSVLGEGEFVGELSLIDGLPRTATARAIEDTVLLEMRRDEFLNFLTQRPSVAISMVSEIGKRLRSTNELVTSLASKNVNVEIEEQLTFGERVADKMAEFGGSWPFLLLFGGFLVAWMVLNTVQLWFHPLDEFPFIFLNLILSCLAAVQAPVIMMSQNRAQKKDRLRADLDYQVNLKSELMIQQLHAKVDELRATDLQQIQSSLEEQLAAVKQRVEELQRAADLKGTGGH